MKDLRRYIQRIILEQINTNNLICYHRSNSLEHMINNDFDLEFSNEDDSVFGRALYFAESSQISSQLGKYICKFQIKLAKPILDLNKEISNDEANVLLEKFNKMFYTDVEYDFNEAYNRVQYGEFFLELIGNNQYFEKFIRSLGYNSFMHYCDYGTNFITTKGDHGRCYGIYNANDIMFLDGPF